jgi:biotin operon repressor
MLNERLETLLQTLTDNADKYLSRKSLVAMLGYQYDPTKIFGDCAGPRLLTNDVRKLKLAGYIITSSSKGIKLATTNQTWDVIEKQIKQLGNSIQILRGMQKNVALDNQGRLEVGE